MFRELRNTAKITFVIHTRSPLAIRNKKSDVLNPILPDMQCMRSRYHGVDTVIIPGSSLKGMIRSHYERIAKLFGATCCDVLDHSKRNTCNNIEIPDNVQNRAKYTYEHMCHACRLFGSTEIASRIRVIDAYPVEGEGLIMGERTGVGINRVTGASQQGALYDFEIVEEGSFQAEIYLQNYELYQLVLLLHVLNDMNEGYVGLGSATSRGNGRVDIQNVNIAFREYRKNVKCLMEYEQEDIIGTDQTVSYDWSNIFYGETLKQYSSPEQALKEWKDIKIEKRIKK